MRPSVRDISGATLLAPKSRIGLRPFRRCYPAKVLVEHLRAVSALSLAWPCLVPCFQRERSEVLVHPLGSLPDVGKGHAHHLRHGHPSASRRARTELRRQKCNRVSQSLNNSETNPFVEEQCPLFYVEGLLALRHHVVRAGL